MSEDTHDLVAAYALDALDELERRRFEAHLDGCPSCLEELSGFSEVAGALVDADASPPAALKGATLEAITGTQQVSGPVAPDPVARESVPTRTVESAPAPGGGAARAERDRWPLLAAAAVVFVVALAAVGLVISGTNGDGPDAEVAAVVDAPDAVMVALHSDDVAREGTDLAVVHSDTHNATVVVGDHVHGTDETHVYQLWGETPAGMEPAGVFTPGEDGTVAIPVDADLSDVESWNITIEPVGGSTEPTTEIVFTSAA